MSLSSESDDDNVVLDEWPTCVMDAPAPSAAADAAAGAVDAAKHRAFTVSCARGVYGEPVLRRLVSTIEFEGGAFRFRDAVARGKRKKLSLTTRRVVVQRQDGACAACRAALDPRATDFDHVIPLAVWDRGHHESCLQAVCPTDHALKSRSGENEAIARFQAVAANGRRLCWFCDAIVAPAMFHEIACFDCVAPLWERFVGIAGCAAFN